MHPSKLIIRKYPNCTAQTRLENLLTIKEGTRLVNKKQQRVIFFRHDDFEGTEICCVRQWVKIVQEGHQQHFFDESNTEQSNTGGAVDNFRSVEENGDEIEATIFYANNCAEDIAMVRNQGLYVDDDNDPAPENVPTGTATDDQGQEWGWSGTCNRTAAAAQNHCPYIVGVRGVTLG